jgi:hypothetical protein
VRRHEKAPVAGLNMRWGRSRRHTLAAVIASLFAALIVTALTAPAGLAAVRGYEMVSPPDKNGADVAGGQTSITAASDGNGIAYTAIGSFAGTLGALTVGQTSYVARRSADGWRNLAVTPTPAYDTGQVLAGTTSTLFFSNDLRRVVVPAWDLPAVTDDVPNAPSLYLEDTLTRGLQTLTSPQAGPVDYFTYLFDYLFPTQAFAGVSRDTRHVAFRASARLLPDAPLFVPSVYEWDQGTLRLASILPNGAVAEEGALPARLEYRGGVSPDGSMVTFVSPPGPEGQLYARIDHSRTALVSEPETSAAAPPPENVAIQEVTGDSRHVIFDTTSQLLDEDTNSGPDLYMYTDGPDPANESNLTLVTTSGDIPAVGDIGEGDNPATAVLGSSRDGGRIYYHRGAEILLWENGTTRPIATAQSPDGQFGGIFYRFGPGASPGADRVSPDGRYLAIYANHVVSSGPNPVTGGSAGSKFHVFLYDALDEEIRCVSCPSGGTATVDASVSPREVGKPATGLVFPGVRPSYLADNGKVSFSTAESLVSTDVNGIIDAYQYDPAAEQVELISTGRGSEPAEFVDASVSGDDVFFITRQQLARADRDNLLDIYDARIGGGFAEPPDPPTPCAEEACQGAPAASPATPAVSSAQIVSRGNVTPRRRSHGKHCAKKARRPKGRRGHCTKKQGGTVRIANADRRAAK